MQPYSFNSVWFFVFFFFRYHLGDYGGEILNEVKLNRPEKDMGTTPSSLHNGNHHKVQECKVKVRFFFPVVPGIIIPLGTLPLTIVCLKK